MQVSTLLNTALLSLSIFIVFNACDSEVVTTNPNSPNQELLTKAEEGKSDASAVAVFLDFNFEGQMLSSTSYDPDHMIEQQLLFTIGQLNGDKAVGRLDQLKLENVEVTRSGSAYLITYRASLLVAWSKDISIPELYTLKLPYDLTWDGLANFTEKYMTNCVGWGAHDVDQSNIWYYYRPHHYTCELDEDDIIKTEASVTTSPIMTTGKYPEYHKVWEDNTLEAVVVFGLADEDGEVEVDAGFSGFKSYHDRLIKSLQDRGITDLKVTPEVNFLPDSNQRDITVEAVLASGRQIKSTALLVDNVRTAGARFDARYEELSRYADLIVYNGHAGLGANVRALANKGDWQEGQYSVVFMNGCDTYAYVDEALFEAHAAVNEDDDTGRKYVDVINNAMPSYFFSMASASMALVDGLLSYDAPRTYEELFARVDRDQVILVTGEEDNIYFPGYDPNAPEPVVAPWAGLLHEATLARGEEWHFATPILEPGTYRFLMDGTGDADLYIRVGEAPSVDLFDCRPFSVGSVESCEVNLNSPAQIFGMVRGWYANPNFTLWGGVLK